MNLGYGAAFNGTRTIRENREKYKCNIPWLILFDPTSACNMHCIGCWAGTYGHKYSLSYDDMDKIVREGKELGVYIYMLTGGEPLVKKKDILIPIVIHMSANIFVNILNSYNLYVLVIGIFLVILSTIIIRICKD